MRTVSHLVLSFAFAAFLAACGTSDADTAAGQPQMGTAGPIPEGAEVPADHPPMTQLPADHPTLSEGGQAAPLNQPPGPDARTGIVLETTRAAGYLYALMDFDGDEIWVAGPLAPLEEGDEIIISGIMGMTDFYSRSLDRTFDQILFASLFTRAS